MYLFKGGLNLQPIIIEQQNTDLITVLIPAAVTIVGFIINYFVLNKSIKEQISKKKMDISLESLSHAPVMCLQLFDEMTKKDNQNKSLEMFKDLANKVFAYGSKDSIKLLAELQQNNYKISKNPSSSQPYKTMAYYILLTCQIKSDLTGIEVNPEFWYKLKLNDYESDLNIKQELIRSTNEIVTDLDLNRFLLIK